MNDSAYTNSRRATSSLKQDLFPAKQRGFYSDILREEAEGELKGVKNGPARNESKVWKTVKEKHIPKVTTFKGPEGDDFDLGSSTGPTTASVTNSDFSWSSWEPKVQVPYETEPGQVPRKIAIERLKRQYASQDLTSLLEERGVLTSDLMPHKDFNMRVDLTQADPKNKRLYPPFLSLDIFDNTEYDCRNPQEWLNLGVVKGRRSPVPGKALLSLTGKDVADPDRFKWLDVGVLDYDPETKLYFVRAVGPRGIQHNVIPKGTQLNAYIQRDDGKSKAIPLPSSLTVEGSWIPRIRLMFCAEDPVVFADRVAHAYNLRLQTEALLRYHLYVDCMPVDGVAELEACSLDRMVEWACETSMLRKGPSFGEKVHVLCNEIKLDFARTMNKISFDKTVTNMPQKFWYVTLPEDEKAIVPLKGYHPGVPSCPFDEKFDQFSFLSLLTRAEVIHAMTKVRAECNRVAAMCLFQIPITKSMRLEEFEQTQSQASSQVQLFLKDSWLSTLRSAIRSSLSEAGKGWFNLDETIWEVYKISKLAKFMQLVNFAMQDTLRYLVQDSLALYKQTVHDGCHEVLNVQEDLVWGKDIINSPYK